MKALAALLVASTLAAPAAAGTIDLNISQVARIESGKLVVDLKLGNSGDESALSVTPVLRFGDAEVRGQATPSLAPDDSYEATLSLPVGALGEGRWPYRVAVDYTDQNLYALQALQTQTLVVGNPPPAKVAVPAIQGGELSGDGTLEITVKNLTPAPRTPRVQVLVPEGLVVTEGSRELALDAWQEARLEVPLSNRTALVGSRYPVFVTVEYDDGPVHQAVVAQGSVSIRGVGSFIDRWGRRMSIASLLLVGVWLAVLSTHWLQRRPEAAPSR